MKALKLLEALPSHVRDSWARHAELTASIDDCQRAELEALDPDLRAEADAMAMARDSWCTAIEAEWRPETRSEARARRRLDAYSPP